MWSLSIQFAIIIVIYHLYIYSLQLNLNGKHILNKLILIYLDHITLSNIADYYYRTNTLF